MKIKTKLACLIAISGGFVILATYTLFNSQRVSKILYLQDNIATDILIGTFELNILSNEYLHYHLARTLDQWEDKYATLNVVIGKAQPLFKDDATYLKNIQDHLASIKIVFDKLGQQKLTGNDDPLVDIQSGLYYARIASLSQSLVGVTQKLENRAHLKILAIHQRSGIIIYMIIFSFFVLIAVNALVMVLAVLKPISRLSTAIENVRQGRFDGTIDVTSADEFGLLSMAFNEMTRRLEQITVSRNELEREINERKTTEERLRESESRFALAVEGSNDGIWDWDGKTHTIFLSERWKQIIGYGDHEIKNDFEEWRSRIHPDDYKMVMAANESFFNSDKRHFTYEYRLRHKNGSYRWVLTRGICIRDDQGVPCRMSGAITDITESKHLEAQLQQSKKMEAMGTLSGGIAHEFNNILSIILGNAELAGEDITTESPMQGMLNDIKQASLRGREIVRHLLHFSRPVDQTQSEVNLSALIRDTVGDVKTTLPPTITLSEVIIPDGPIVSGDPAMIKKMIIHLFQNAIHALTNRTGAIRISLNVITFNHGEHFFNVTLPPGDYACLEIEDNGHGISPAYMDRIFDPFFSTREVGKGSGLGLAVVHGIMKGHKGGIRVSSKMNQGTNVQCCFPVLSESEELESVHEKSSQAKGTIRLIYIDDEASIVKLAANRLTRMGYIVETFTNPINAVRHVEDNSQNVDLVITDLTMPEMTGDEVATRIRQINPRIKTIICTGYSEKKEQWTPENSTVDGILVKPFSSEEMRSVIMEVLKKDYTQHL